MEPEIRRVDPSHPVDAVFLLQRGRLLLQALASEAHAARVDVKRAELEMALANAEAGDANALSLWLASYQSTNNGVADSLRTNAAFSNCITSLGAATDAKTDAKEVASTGLPPNPQPAAPRAALCNWETLLPHSRQRLQAVRDDLRKPKGSVQSELGTPTAPIALDQVSLSPGGTVHVPKQELLKIAKAFDASVAEEQIQKQRKFLLLSGVSGFGASLFVHLLVVIVLMIITLKLPATTASLVFEASSTEELEETVELTQPTEIMTAEVTPESPSEVVTDPSESLADIRALTSESLSEATPAQTSSLSNLAAAASAAASSGRPNPANANASFFGASASGNCFCYVIDGSESMRGGPWEAAKSELLRSLATLKENQRFYIVFFNKELSAISMPGERAPAPRPLYATKENLNHARGWIETLRIAPGAPPNKALKLAIEREPDAIYLLTDGDTKVDVAEFLRTNNRTSDFVSGEQVTVPIHSIAFYSSLSY